VGRKLSPGDLQRESRENSTWAFWSLSVPPRNFAIALPLQLRGTVIHCGNLGQSRIG
jgi:hypothetical protein